MIPNKATVLIQRNIAVYDTNITVMLANNEKIYYTLSWSHGFTNTEFQWSWSLLNALAQFSCVNFSIRNLKFQQYLVLAQEPVVFCRVLRRKLGSSAGGDSLRFFVDFLKPIDRRELRLGSFSLTASTADSGAANELPPLNLPFSASSLLPLDKSLSQMGLNTRLVQLIPPTYYVCTHMIITISHHEIKLVCSFSKPSSNFYTAFMY